jgi:hypothetical protein
MAVANAQCFSTGDRPRTQRMVPAQAVPAAAAASCLRAEAVASGAGATAGAGHRQHRTAGSRA